MAVKKTPMRMCIGCREMMPKAQLVRAVRTPEGEILLDTTGKKNGRGAYLCHKEECLRKAAKQNALAHAFGVPVEAEIYDRLSEELKKIDG
ncbi:MAG: YlxR family protein [Clostridia bacterium]|nr:YlxR family protein [Clostridia bacterium]